MQLNNATMVISLLVLLAAVACCALPASAAADAAGGEAVGLVGLPGAGGARVVGPHGLQPARPRAAGRTPRGCGGRGERGRASALEEAARRRERRRCVQRQRDQRVQRPRRLRQRHLRLPGGLDRLHVPPRTQIQADGVPARVLHRRVHRRLFVLPGLHWPGRGQDRHVLERLPSSLLRQHRSWVLEGVLWHGGHGRDLRGGQPPRQRDPHSRQHLVSGGLDHDPDR
ncbi:uncharacterized protein ACA1_107560 [Acanthamoeba castellanii str. Neff]|uniref:Uncharacterized protein n=1 Tax=Acanthamoeba castellanii (strain ATCC 30010 / Neff) TaxID=1257118 RepID=L8GMN8_ACACF|nr:uncharacterized protein ACA1_107560 [Acanthamoeba castellanii str. Neff]ELR14335.1 hypothetical protein ACA1_107560 [Acanthamoeba castellanii str. Neff]